MLVQIALIAFALSGLLSLAIDIGYARLRANPGLIAAILAGLGAAGGGIAYQQQQQKKKRRIPLPPKPKLPRRKKKNPFKNVRR